MKSEIKKQIGITLLLNEKEARWLKDMVQNYLSDGEESEFNRDMREKFWNELIKIEK